MPPKKATKAKASAKKKPASPPPPPPPPPKRRRAVSRSPSEPIPEWDKGLSTLAARERKRFKLSHVSLHEDLDEEYIAQQAEKLMGESRNTWGVAHQSPIKGSRRSKPKSRGLNRGRDIEDAYMEMFANINPQRRQAIPNCLDRSPILRIPLEIRERIYENLLIYPTPIMVKSDWTSLERNKFANHSVILVCKQFALEASSFLYKNNTFQSLIRESSNPPLRFEAPGKLPTAFHSLFRNVIIDCSKSCWNLDWHNQLAEGLNALVKANPTIVTLTLVVVPQRVGMSDTALGMEASPITFADFLWYSSPFMKAIRKLAPKTFKVVVKKPGKRLSIVIDLTCLRIGTAENNLLVNDETLRRRDMVLSVMRDELKNLKARFEDAFEDDEWAVRQGLCDLISAGNGRRDEEVLDGGEAGDAIGGSFHELTR